MSRLIGQGPGLCNDDLDAQLEIGAGKVTMVIKDGTCLSFIYGARSRRVDNVGETLPPKMSSLAAARTSGECIDNLAGA
jgi:hypothetical protein